MKGLKIIPMFGALLVLAYFGVLFVRQNPAEVAVSFGSRATAPAALGFVILTSVLVGMIFAGILCSIELVVLYMENQRLKRKLFPHRNANTGSILPWKGLDKELIEDTDDLSRTGAEPRRTENTGSGH